MILLIIDDSPKGFALRSKIIDYLLGVRDGHRGSQRIGVNSEIVGRWKRR